MESLRFTATVFEIKDRLLVRLPEEMSKQLSSRGQIAVAVGVKDYAQVIVLEPDGEWGHWMNIVPDMKLKAGDTGAFTITPTKEWPEVTVPSDVQTALQNAPKKVQDKWSDITPMARWEWIRWINATKSTDTRKVRIEKTVSKLNGKHRRPCCFNIAACTDAELSKNSRLIGIND